jgi:hypothetical protein
MCDSYQRSIPMRFFLSLEGETAAFTVHQAGRLFVLTITEAMATAVAAARTHLNVYRLFT